MVRAALAAAVRAALLELLELPTPVVAVAAVIQRRVALVAQESSSSVTSRHRLAQQFQVRLIPYRP
jgi:hypothetical protein